MLKRWRVLVGVAVLLAIGVYMAAHGVTQSSTNTGTQVTCPRISREAEQPIDLVAVDGSVSTASLRLRSEYAQTVAEIAEEAATQGSYLVIDRFAASIAGIETICETSTRVSAAAPLFADARRTVLQRMLVGVSSEAANLKASEHGTDILAALIDAIERIQVLRGREHVVSRIVILTDGDQVADGVSLRHLLETGSDLAAARRIAGGQVLPGARGIAIEIRGVGRVGVGGTTPTRTVLRMEHVWRLICTSTHAKSCLVGSNLTD